MKHRVYRLGDKQRQLRCFSFQHYYYFFRLNDMAFSKIS